MSCTRFVKALFAIGAAPILTATSAGAHGGHAGSFTLSDHSVGAYPDTTATFTFGSDQPDELIVDFGPGWRLAHDDGHASEVTPNPQDEERVGSVSLTGNFVFSLCRVTTLTLDASWEEDMTGAPAGPLHVVAHDTLTDGAMSSTVGISRRWGRAL